MCECAVRPFKLSVTAFTACAARCQELLAKRALCPCTNSCTYPWQSKQSHFEWRSKSCPLSPSGMALDVGMEALYTHRAHAQAPQGLWWLYSGVAEAGGCSYQHPQLHTQPFQHPPQTLRQGCEINSPSPSVLNWAISSLHFSLFNTQSSSESCAALCLSEHWSANATFVCWTSLVVLWLLIFI